MATVCKTMEEVVNCLERKVALQLDASMVVLDLKSELDPKKRKDSLKIK